MVAPVMASGGACVWRKSGVRRSVVCSYIWHRGSIPGISALRPTQPPSHGYRGSIAGVNRYRVVTLTTDTI
jgi:hypothetical protein